MRIFVALALTYDQRKIERDGRLYYVAYKEETINKALFDLQVARIPFKYAGQFGFSIDADLLKDRRMDRAFHKIWSNHLLTNCDKDFAEKTFRGGFATVGQPR